MADDFFNSGYDVVVSGIDTTEALVTEAAKFAEPGQEGLGVPYDYAGRCDEAPRRSPRRALLQLGPGLSATTVKAAMDGQVAVPLRVELGPDWKNINNPDTSAVGFNKGKALSAGCRRQLDEFIAELAGGLNLWKGPLNLQDGTAYLDDGEVGHRPADLVPAPAAEGMEGQSVSK